MISMIKATCFFEHQLSYISACILFFGQQGLNTNLEQCELLH